MEEEMETIKRYTEDPKQIKKIFMTRGSDLLNGTAQCCRNPQERLFKVEKFDASTLFKIGKGSFAEVYKVRHHNLKSVAVKQFRDDVPTDAAWKELDVLMNFQSDCIVKLFGACVM